MKGLMGKPGRQETAWKLLDNIKMGLRWSGMAFTGCI